MAKDARAAAVARIDARGEHQVDLLRELEQRHSKSALSFALVAPEELLDLTAREQLLKSHSQTHTDTALGG